MQYHHTELIESRQTTEFSWLSCLLKPLLQPFSLMLISGAVLYMIVLYLNKPVIGDDYFYPAGSTVEISIDQEGIDKSIQDFYIFTGGKKFSDREKEGVVQWMVYNEILLDYAYRVGLERDDMALKRLLNIGRFTMPDDSKTDREVIRFALDMGLGDNDPVLRQILIDNARRLIRATALARPLSEEMLQEYYENNKNRYQLSGRYDFSHIMLARITEPLAPGETDSRAAELANEISSLGLTVEDALSKSLSTSLLLSYRNQSSIQIRNIFGKSFAQQVEDIEVGKWVGPIESRHGVHLVLVQERNESRIPPLSEIRAQVNAEARQYYADAYLQSRLKQLSAHYDIKVRGETYRLP